jgi:hypothetical protein
MLKVGKEVSLLVRMSAKQLRQKYYEVFGEENNSRNKAWLVKRIAWRLQVLAEGGLSERAIKRAAGENYIKSQVGEGWTLLREMSCTAWRTSGSKSEGVRREIGMYSVNRECQSQVVTRVERKDKQPKVNAIACLGE